MIRLSVATALYVVLSACSGGGDPVVPDSEVEDCTECPSSEFCVANIGGDRDFYECREMPGECGTRPSCEDEDCLAEFYDSCADGFAPVGCSDTVPPAIVSCNP